MQEIDLLKLINGGRKYGLLIWKQQLSVTLRPRQNACHFSDNIIQHIILNETFWIFNKISLKYVP